MLQWDVFKLFAPSVVTWYMKGYELVGRRSVTYDSIIPPDPTLDFCGF